MIITPCSGCETHNDRRAHLANYVIVRELEDGTWEVRTW